eukprot:CAMPEP_0185534002 /NCGR_PEP_ID=MMETSP1366-20130426/108730_1 /TAXON_ID=38817 /ORGANISM="Gephyrocapsa oceanica, Strain RCC1303" /LENGTH=503 /DNA_ID=CAMNT_0028145727 /DNA_START=27 /DNA_END=1535 /DNA_ORIENTATION=+
MKDLARGIELICVLLSALLATGLLPGASPATCAAPFLFGVAVRVGYPPAGKGVGQPAPSLAEGLEVVSVSELGAADRGGEGDGDGSAGSRSPVEPWHLLPKASLAAGKVHVLCFCGASLGPQIVTALRRVQAAYVSSRALPVSFLLISRASADEVAAYASGALAGAGAGAPIARDATGATSDSYLTAFAGGGSGRPSALEAEYLPHISPISPHISPYLPVSRALEAEHVFLLSPPYLPHISPISPHISPYLPVSRALEAEHVFLSPNQHWRGHGLRCTPLYPAVPRLYLACTSLVLRCTPLYPAVPRCTPLYLAVPRCTPLYLACASLVPRLYPAVPPLYPAAFASLVLTRSEDAGACMAQVPHVFVVGADGAIAWHGHSSRRQFTLYLTAFCGRWLRPVPHVFVVGADGAIAWHGHSSRRQFTLALSAALRRAAGRGAEGGGGEAAADGSAEKKKADESPTSVLADWGWHGAVLGGPPFCGRVIDIGERAPRGGDNRGVCLT